MFRKVKKFIKAVEMRSAMRIEIPEKGNFYLHNILN